jgi:hypothetical protein
VRGIAKKFQGQPLVVLSVSLDGDEQKWKDFIAKNGMTWPQYYDGGFTGPISKLFGVQAIPHTFTIDADGVLQDEHIGDASIEGKLKKWVGRARELQAAETAGCLFGHRVFGECSSGRSLRLVTLTNDQTAATEFPASDPARPMLHVVFDFNLVDNIAFHQILQHPAQMLRGDAEHGRAKASGVVEGDDLLTFRRELLAHTVDQVDFRAHSEHGARRGFTDHRQQAFGGTDGVGFLADLPPAFRMGDHAYAGYLARTLSACSGRKR